MKLFNLSVLFGLFLLIGCKTNQPALVNTAPLEEVIIEERDLDTMVVTAPKPNKLKTPQEYSLPPYAPSFTLDNDLLHTILDLRFNWAEELVYGKATLKLQPWFYPTNQVRLDAKDFDFHSITLVGEQEQLKYDYDGSQIIIYLGKTFTRTEQYELLIDYTARPSRMGGQGGSAAITSDQGLFFINPKGEEPDKPTQIWTLGETEWNSRWFPTIDKPNERCTQEMYLTVEDKYQTLSNGLMLSSTKNADGTRTDYYKMDQPHAPYLFMITIGEFAVEKESWEGIPLEYYVEHDYKESAKNIFAHTPEMLTFFSKITGVKFPWPKYSQVVVRDFVSGAMENTTGVTFGDFVQKTNRELIDNHNDGIVAHELFHHWFGDYVTCESWSNLTMNEGFANYSEYLWFEHKYGVDDADRHRQSEMRGYLESTATGGAHPLIHFGVADKEDMFDAHSYNKGGLVLHMLRNYIGDDAFFATLEKYLKDNAYAAVEAHDLRLVTEEVCGQDFN
ncbi:MAG: M1 family metallopeptidase, partial [Bacteroidota bacterium]